MEKCDYGIKLRIKETNVAGQSGSFRWVKCETNWGERPVSGGCPPAGLQFFARLKDFAAFYYGGLGWANTFQLPNATGLPRRETTQERMIALKSMPDLAGRGAGYREAFGGSSSDCEKASSTFWVMRDTLLSYSLCDKLAHQHIDPTEKTAPLLGVSK